MLLEQGMAAAIIQRRDLRDEHLDAAFWMILAASTVLMGLSIAGSGWWASVNRLPDLAPVISALSVTVPLQGLAIVQRAIYQRDMDFRTLAIRTNASVVIGGVIGFVMAVGGFGVWALVGQQISTSAFGVLLLWSMSRWRPRMRFERDAARDLLGFSVMTLVGRLGVFTANRSDALLMGIFFGPTAVGLYRLADRIMNLWVSVAGRSIQSVALPELSRHQDDLPALRVAMLRCIRTTGTLAIPPLTVMAAGSAEVMRIIGTEWSEAAAPLSALCGFGIVASMTQLTAPLLQSLGRPRALAMLIWATAIPLTAAFCFAGVVLGDADTELQAFGIALSRFVLIALVFLPLHTAIACRMLGVGPGAFLKQLAPAIFGSALGGSTIVIVRWSAWLPSVEPRFDAALLLVCGGVVAVGSLLAIDRPLREMIRRRLEALGIRRGAPV
jgi:PST family polysaccharide transporter